MVTTKRFQATIHRKFYYRYLCVIVSIFMGAEWGISETFAVPSSPSFVTVSGRDIMLQRRLADNSLSTPIVFTMNGLDWNPVPSGSTTPDWADYYVQDLTIMAGINASVVRTYGPLPMNSTGLAVLDYCYNHNIYVIMDVGYYYSTNTATNDAQVTAVVNFFKNHSALLMFEVGNEWNYNFGYNSFGNSIQTSAITVQHIATVIKASDGQHAVTSSLGSAYDSTPFNDGVMTTCSNIDVWGFNTYAVGDVSGAVTAASTYSTKPYYFSEIGTDAFNELNGQEDQANQSKYELLNWTSATGNSQLTVNNGSFSGELFFEFSDEWWKDSGAGTSISTHDNGGGLDPNSYDGFGNSEWYGFVDINRNQRQVCSAFQTAWAGLNAISGQPSPSPTLTPTPSPTNAPTPTTSPIGTPTPTNTPTPSPTPTNAPVPTSIPTKPPTPTAVPTPTPSPKHHRRRPQIVPVPVPTPTNRLFPTPNPSNADWWME